MQNLTTCPVCGGESSKKVMDCIDYTVSRETFSIVQCTKCGFKYTNPRPDDKEIGKYYESEEYVSHSNSKKGLINTVYHWVRNYSLRKKVELINNQAKKGNLLDIGGIQPSKLMFQNFSTTALGGINFNFKYSLVGST